MAFVFNLKVIIIIINAFSYDKNTRTEYDCRTAYFNRFVIIVIFALFITVIQCLNKSNQNKINLY